MQYRAEKRKKEGIKNNPDFELEEADAQSEEKKCKRGAPILPKDQSNILTSASCA